MKKLFIVAVAAILVASMLPMHAQPEVLLKIGCQDEPKTLNIWKATDVWSTHVDAWFYPSFYYRKPVTNEPLPDFCTIPFADLQAQSPDGLTFTFPLRENEKWDDGTPVTAYDFEFSYNLIVEMEFPDYLPVYEDVEYIKATGDYTIEMKLAKCTPQFEESLIYHFAVPQQQFGPMAEQSRGTDVPMQTFLDLPVDDPVSCGPFTFAQWERGSFVKLVTNPGYYGKGRTVNVEGVGTITEGPDYDGLLLKLYGTTDAALLGIQKGEIDYIWWNLDPGYIAQLLGKENVSIAKSEELGFYYLAPNLAKEPFDDKVLRQAMVYLVQKDFIVSRVLQGYGGSAHSVVMPAAGDWYNPNINKYGDGMAKEDRIAKAKEMLTAAGYTVPDVGYADGGIVKLPDGTDMPAFEILTPPADYDPMRAMSGVLIQEWWREIGIPVTAKPTSFGEIVHKTFEAMTFDWYILGWRIGGTGYSDHMRYFFHSDQAVPDGNNPMSFKNPECDKYLEDLMTLCDRDELINASWKAQEIIVDEVGYCALYYRTMNEAYRTDNFSGWFSQLGGIAGTESPRHCLLYLKPVTEAPTETTAPPAATTKAPEDGGTCLGTILLVGMLAAGAALVYRRRN
jgi:peptide/nickel transport system substrate-binding protein